MEFGFAVSGASGLKQRITTTAFSYGSNFYGFFHTRTIIYTTLRVRKIHTHIHNRMPSIWNVNANRHFRCYECKRKKMWCEMWKCHYCRMQRESELCILPINLTNPFESVRDCAIRQKMCQNSLIYVYFLVAWINKCVCFCACRHAGFQHHVTYSRHI